ncbi:MAG: GNAT family N-acetyltransferase [Trueperaceae bacterium]
MPTSPTAEARIVVAAAPELLGSLTPNAQLDRFREPRQQLQALQSIAQDEQGTVTALVRGSELLGYAVFHPPTEIEAWGHDRTGRILELGAIEVAPAERGQRWAERLLQASFADGRFDHTVVFATLYSWHYDLARSGLGDLAYRRMLERLYRSAGLELFATTDEEVRSSPANALMARIGQDAPEHVVAEFHRLRGRLPGAPVAPW